jgi:hypothetical protein
VKLYDCWLEGDIYLAGTHLEIWAPTPSKAKANMCSQWAEASGGKQGEAFAHARCKRIYHKRDATDEELGKEGALADWPGYGSAQVTLMGPNICRPVSLVSYYSHLTDAQNWGAAIREAASYAPEVIEWNGWPDLDQAIYEYVSAGGEL